MMTFAHQAPRQKIASVPHMLKNMVTDIHQARNILRRMKMRKYGRIVRYLYVQSIKASGKGHKVFRYIYQKIPVPEDGLASIYKIREYLSKAAGVQCNAIRARNNVEIGINIFLR